MVPCMVHARYRFGAQNCVDLTVGTKFGCLHCPFFRKGSNFGSKTRLRRARMAHTTMPLQEISNRHDTRLLPWLDLDLSNGCEFRPHSDATLHTAHALQWQSSVTYLQHWSTHSTFSLKGLFWMQSSLPFRLLDLRLSSCGERCLTIRRIALKI